LVCSLCPNGAQASIVTQQDQGNRLKPVGGPGRDCAGPRRAPCPALSARRAPAPFLPRMVRAIAAGVAWRVRRRGWAGWKC